MKLGMPTLIEYRTLQQNAELCCEMGLDFIELNMNLPICLPENLQVHAIEKMKEQYKIGFTIHLPEEIDLGSFHPSIRVGHLERCMETLQWANQAHIKTVNMHLNTGIYFTLPEEKVWVNERYESQFAEAVYESYATLLDLAARFHIDVCVENTMNFHLPFVERTLTRLMDFDNFYLTWDTGHDGKCGFQESDFIKRHIHRLKHMHLHDYNETIQSDHQPLYTGTVPIDQRLQLADELGLSVVIEVKTSDSLSESVMQLRKRSKQI